MIIAVDFDGTIVEHEYPRLGKPIPYALEKLHRWFSDGHKIILYTMRSGQELDEAVQYITRNGIGLYGINSNPDQHKWTKSPKVYAHIYIDDAAYGCPLKTPKDSRARPYVDWNKIELM